MRESFAAFKELVTKFPDSRYAPDSAERMRYLTNALALYEVKVARYYYNRGAYVAAANRAQVALITYPHTPANEEALDVLAQSYDKLGLPQLRDDSQRSSQDLPDSVRHGSPTSRGGSSGPRQRATACRPPASWPTSRGGKFW